VLSRMSRTTKMRASILPPFRYLLVGSAAAAMLVLWRAQRTATDAPPAVPAYLDPAVMRWRRPDGPVASIVDDQRHGTWEGSPPQVAVISSVIKSDMTQLKGFAADVYRQTLEVPWELLVCSENAEVLRAFNDALSDDRYKWPPHFRWRTVQLAHDVGLYEIWDLLANMTSAMALTNWNVDDRKHPDSLATKWAVLRDHLEVDVVTSAIAVVWPEGPTPSWSESVTPEGAARAGADIWWTYLEGRLSLERFVKRSPQHQIENTQNLPHNSPMWRRAIHADPHIGGFADARFGLPFSPRGQIASCADWALWTRVVLAERLIWHVKQPLELYAARRTSHNRRSPALHNRCVERAMEPITVRLREPPFRAPPDSVEY